MEYARNAPGLVVFAALREHIKGRGGYAF